MSKHASMTVRVPIEVDNVAIQRDESLCIKCGNCIRVCTNDLGVSDRYTLEETGDVAICVHCGQCANACPPAAITEVDEVPAILQKCQVPGVVLIFSTSPSVRVGLGEEFGLPPGTDVEALMVSALRALGAHYVLDTNFSADLTITEEASELVRRVTTQDRPLPQFTSCCPAWVKYAETFYPDLLAHISSAKSPIGMQGPTIKTWFAQRAGLDPRSIVNIAVTPCTAKKFEIRREEMNASAQALGIPGLRDMDHVITTRELARWIRQAGIDFSTLPPKPFDPLMGSASGAGIIFGNTGGVMEAAVRTASAYVTGSNPGDDFLKLVPVRGLEGVKEATVSIGPTQVRVAVVNGLANVRPLVDQLRTGTLPYEFVEVMSCRGGCIGGGGQPRTKVPMSDAIRQKRIDALYRKDEAATIRLSHENPEIKAVYADYYGQPLSERAEKMLHTRYASRAATLGKSS